MKLTVLGDIGCYTLGRVRAARRPWTPVVCMGASIGMRARIYDTVRPDAARRAVAVIGDSTFMHSGITGVVNVAYNKGISTVIVLDNAITGMTGHQQNPTTGLTLQQRARTVAIRIEERLPRGAASGACAWSIRNDMRAVEAASQGGAGRRRAVGHHRPPPLRAAQVRQARTRRSPSTAAKCRRLQARACASGCPAISFAATARPASTRPMCVGCGLCEQTVPRRARFRRRRRER